MHQFPPVYLFYILLYIVYINTNKYYCIMELKIKINLYIPHATLPTAVAQAITKKK